MELKLENATFQSNLPELLREHKGKFVLIYRCEIVGVFGHPANAVSAGYERFELKPFLIEEVKAPGAQSRWGDIDVASLLRVLHPSVPQKLLAWIQGVEVENI